MKTSIFVKLYYRLLRNLFEAGRRGCLRNIILCKTYKQADTPALHTYKLYILKKFLREYTKKAKVVIMDI